MSGRRVKELRRLFRHQHGHAPREAGFQAHEHTVNVYSGDPEKERQVVDRVQYVTLTPDAEVPNELRRQKKFWQRWRRSRGKI